MNERNNINIAQLSLNHLPEIIKIERECFSDAWSENMFLETFANPLTQGYVAQDAGLLGFILYYNLAPEIQILNIAVRKSARSMGVGSLLLKEALSCENISLATLEVRESNFAAINLYKKFGFKIDGLRKNYYTHPREDAMLMSLET